VAIARDFCWLKTRWAGSDCFFCSICSAKQAVLTARAAGEADTAMGLLHSSHLQSMISDSNHTTSHKNNNNNLQQALAL
jgi:hypothetical protein